MSGRRKPVGQEWAPNTVVPPPSTAPTQPWAIEQPVVSGTPDQMIAWLHGMGWTWWVEPRDHGGVRVWIRPLGSPGYSAFVAHTLQRALELAVWSVQEMTPP